MATKPKNAVHHSTKPNETIKSSLSSQAFQPDPSDQSSDSSDSSDDSDAPPLPKSKISKKRNDGHTHLKEPPSAYNEAIIRPSVTQPLPGKVVTLRLWANMSAAEKEPYKTKAQPAKEAYKQTLQTLGIKHKRSVTTGHEPAKSTAERMYTVCDCKAGGTGASRRVHEIQRCLRIMAKAFAR
ncbi:hypothetical protein BJ741DRAFT_707463 [Chytriomyces cf. hyalinus JEL632]|nr:hypothetical protein BJ741DRAFT_707463 [Chytriomyces cf. hyalinus JEL632]